MWFILSLQWLWYVTVGGSSSFPYVRLWRVCRMWFLLSLWVVESKMWYIFSLLMFLHHPTHVVRNKWEVLLIWPMHYRWTHRVLSYSLCLRWMMFLQLDHWGSSPIGVFPLVMWTNFSQWRVAVTHSRSILLYYSYHYSTKQRWDEIQRWFMTTGWHNVCWFFKWILPSWKGVLNLATRAKFHFGLLLWIR